MAGIVKSNIQLGDSATATQNFMITAQAADGTMKIARGNNGATTQDIINVDVNGLVTLSQGRQLTLGVAQNTTSGTSIDFTGIPSWVKRITISLRSVSTNGASLPQIQIGSGSIATSGYGCIFTAILTGNITSTAATTTGFPFNSNSSAASYIVGHAVLTLVSGNTWLFSANAADGNGNRAMLTVGDATLSGPLDRIRLTTLNGTDTFDGGSVNIMYEG
jgi:hypothetical protein